MKLLVAALVTAACQGAMAAFNADVQLNRLGYELIDLRPDDGIDAAADFSRNIGGTYLYAYLFSERENKTYFAPGRVDGTFEPFVSGNLKPMASIHSEAIWTDGRLDWRIHATAESNASDRGGFLVTYYKDIPFTLAPHTQIVWRGDYVVDVSADRSSNASPLWSSRADLRYPNEYQDIHITAEAFMDPAQGTDMDRRTGSVSFTITNPYDTELDYWMLMRVNLYGGNILAVPEPSSSAMMALGMGLLAACARKRRRAGSPAEST